MRFQPQVDQVLAVGKERYEIEPHPMVPQLPYGQEGRMATVYKIRSDGKNFALKVFKDAYRKPDILDLSEKLKNYAVIPGLEACQRLVINPVEHKALIKRDADLNFAVIMPWIEGQTWFDILTEKEPLSREQCERLAREFCRTLVSMEERSVAHCDLSSPNVILANLDTVPRISLVDVEQLFGPTLQQPDLLLVGTPGYITNYEKAAFWSRFSDRFAGAILLAEMLCWHSAEFRAASWGDSYFDPAELRKACERYDLMQKTLEEGFGEEVGELLARVWAAGSFETCPSFWEWNRILSGESDTVAMRRTMKSNPVIMALANFETRARDQMLSGNLESAITEYEAALSYAVEHDVSPDTYIERINELSLQQIAGYWVEDKLHERAFEIVDLQTYDPGQASGKKLGGFKLWQLIVFVVLVSGSAFVVFSEWGAEIRGSDIYLLLSLQVTLAAIMMVGIRKPFLVAALYFIVSSVVGLALNQRGSVLPPEELILHIGISAVILEIFFRVGLALVRDTIRHWYWDLLWVVIAAFLAGGYLELQMQAGRLDSWLKVGINLGLAVVGWLLGKWLASVIITLRERT